MEELMSNRWEESCKCSHAFMHHNENGDCTDCDCDCDSPRQPYAWKQGDRVTWLHREGPEGGWRTVMTHGTVREADDRRVLVDFDEPVNGVTDCTTVPSELVHEQEQCHYCREWFPKPVSLHHHEDDCKP